VIKAEYSASLLQSSGSHDPSEITLIWGSDAQNNLMIKKIMSLQSLDTINAWIKELTSFIKQKLNLLKSYFNTNHAK